MITHEPHVENARRALKALDASPTGAEAGVRAIRVASALRVLLDEPADGHQGWFMPCECIGCRGRPGGSEDNLG